MLLVIVCAAFAVALGVTLYNKIKGKSGCDCGGSCSSCAGCSHAKTASKPHGDETCCGGPHCAMCEKESGAADKID